MGKVFTQSSSPVAVCLAVISVICAAPSSRGQSDDLVIGTRKYRRTEFRVNSGSTETSQRANVAVLTTGNFLVVWHDGSPSDGSPTDCFGRIYSPTGSADSVIKSLHPFGSSGQQYGPSAAPLPGGGFVATWGGAQTYVHGQRFSSSFTTIGGEFALANMDAWPAMASFTNGEFVVALGTCNSILYARHFDTNVVPGDLFPVSTYVSGCYHPSVAYSPDGRFTIAWPAGANIMARTYQLSESSPFGPESPVNTANTWSCYHPSVQYNQSNELFIAWSASGTADSQGIYLRRYGADMVPAPVEVLVNSNIPPSQSQPNLGIGRNNEIIVSWKESDDVFARLLDRHLSPLAPEFRVNKYTSGTQTTADRGGLHGAAILDNTNIVVSWTGDGASGKGVYVTLLQYLGDSDIAITSQPTNQDVLIGTAAAFCVTATSQDPIGYQWQFNSVNIDGATNPCFTIASAQLSDAGLYRCLLTNSMNSRTSEVAKLAVHCPKSAREYYTMGYTNNGMYTIDPDGTNGQAPFSIYCLMSVSGGGWAQLNSTTAHSALNTNVNVFREYLFVKNNTTCWYRTPVNNLPWSWDSGQDLYGRYYYSCGAGESNFWVWPGEAGVQHQLYGVGGSSGPNRTNKCLINYWDYYDPANAQTFICQDSPGIFGETCAGPATVYIREWSFTNLWPLVLAASPAGAGVVTGAGSYPEDVQAAIAATALPGYQFSHWIGDGIENTNESLTTILMTEPRTATASFRRNWKLTVTAEPPGSGQVTGSGDYTNGASAPITATPGPANWFLGWSGTGVEDTNAEVTTVLMDGDRQVTGFFTAPDLEIAQISAPSNALGGHLIRMGWTITNSGTAAGVGTWSDAIWLSSDNQMGDDVPASTNLFTGRVNLGGSITRQQGLVVPATLYGAYWIVAEVNHDRGLAEISYSNNLAVSSQPIVITPTPYPNLQVSVVFAPTNVFAGQETEAYWIVTNAGTRSTESAVWEDAVYLSTDTIWDPFDTYLGSVANPAYLDPGQAYNSSLPVTIPQKIQGPYYFLVRADFRNRVNEGGLDGDNNGASNPMQVTLPGWPDLQIATVTAPYDSFSGQGAIITWAVTNTGSMTTDTSSWNERIYLSTSPSPGPGMTALATVPHTGALQAGESYSVSQQVMLPIGISGTNFYFLVQADANNQVWEYVYENNNYGSSTHPTTIVLTPPPDLEVVSVSAPSNVCAGFDLPVSFRVANNGANPTPNYSWQDGIYLSADAHFDPYADIRVGSTSHWGQLQRTDFYDIAASVHIPPNVTGNRYLIVVTDWRNEVFELDKTNNCHASAFPVNILPLADLEVGGVTGPSNALSGFDFTVNYYVTNGGSCSTIPGYWQDSFYLSADPVLDVSSDTLLGTAGHSGALASGGVYAGMSTLSLPVGLSGDYYLFAVTDSRGEVPEQNEGNNAAIAPIPIHLRLPDNDLQVVRTEAPTTALSGFNLTVSCVITNRGTNVIPNSSWRDGFYLSTNQVLSIDDYYLREITNHLSLAGGGSYTNSVTVRLADGLSGNFYLFAYADSGSEVFEQNETNNSAIHPIAIAIASIPPDLVIDSCYTPSGTYIAGTSLPVNWSVRNHGPGRTSMEAWSDRVVLSKDPITGNDDDLALLQSSHTGGLDSDQSYSASASMNIPADTSAGVYHVFVQTDSAGQVYEGGANTNNYCFCGTISVIRPDVDLVVYNVAVPAEGYSGQSFPVVWTVQNLGNSPANPTAWSDAVYLSRDPELGTNSTLLGRVPHSGGLASLASYTVTNQFTLPWDVQSDYYVIVRTDSEGQVPELVDTNNDAASSSPSYIFLSPTPDLLVTALNVPAEAVSGQPISISWSVLNNGTATAESWYDSVYLSYDNLFDRDSDMYLGYVQHNGGLDEGSSYRVTNTFNVPADLYGTFYVFLVTDSGNRVYERGAEANNTALSSAVSISLPQVADLVVTAVTPPPGRVMVGERNTVTYHVLNQTTASVTGRWEDSIYLSLDSTWDIGDTLLGKVTVNRSLGPWESYAESLTAQVPGVLPGNYYVLVRTDIRDRIPESDEANNMGVSSQAFPVDITELILGVPCTNEFAAGSEHFYKVDITNGATLAVTLDTYETTGVSELFTRFGAVPNRAQYDFGYSNPFAPDQQIVVPETQTGQYYNLVRGQEVPVSPATYTIEASTVPFGIKSVAPTHIGDNGQVTLTLTGARFASNASVCLFSEGASFVADRVVVVDSTLARATFHMTNAAHGPYSVGLTNATLESTTLTNGVIVETSTGIQVEIFASGNLTPRVGTAFETSAMLVNTGNVDAPYVLLLAEFNETVTMGWSRPGLAIPAQTNFPGADWPNASPTASLLNGSTIDNFFLRDLPPQSQVPFNLHIKGFDAGPFKVSLAVHCAGVEPFQADLLTTVEALRLRFLQRGTADLPDPLGSYLNDPVAWSTYFWANFAAMGLVGPGPAPAGAVNPGWDTQGCSPGYPACLAVSDQFLEDCKRACNRCGQLPEPATPLCDPFWGSIGRGGWPGAVWDATCSWYCTSEWLQRLYACRKDACTPVCQVCTAGRWEWLSCHREDAYFTRSTEGCGEGRRPVDPNEKVAPWGFGAERFVAATAPLQYTIRFENLPTSRTAAREIVIADRLDNWLDPRTVQLNEISLGGYSIPIPNGPSSYQTRILLGSTATNLIADILATVDLSSRQLKVDMHAIDSTTGEMPLDPTVGLLRPNDRTHRGEGYVSYNVRPLPGVPTGTVITNRASIVFDNNEPMETTPVWNTIDSAAPVTVVSALATFVPTNFLVSWSGSDDFGGSGVQNYDIYVSDNNGPQQLWLASAIESCSVYSGQLGHTYAFYSRGRDKVGNVESAPPTNDTTTIVVSNQPPAIDPVTNRFVVVGQQLVITNIATDPDGVTFSLCRGAPAGASMTTNGIFSWTPACYQGSTTNLITICVTDFGMPPASNSTSFIIIVPECIEAGLGSTVMRAGSTSSVPVRLLSTTALTNMGFTVVYPAERFTTNFTLTVNSPQILTQRLHVLAGGRLEVSFTLPADSVLYGPTNVGELGFTAVSSQSSAFVPLAIAEVSGYMPNGKPVGNWYGYPGRVVVVGQEPLLEAFMSSNHSPALILYASPGTTNTLELSSTLQPLTAWSTGESVVVPSNALIQVVQPIVVTNNTVFIRAMQRIEN